MKTVLVKAAALLCVLLAIPHLAMATCAIGALGTSNGLNGGLTFTTGSVTTQASGSNFEIIVHTLSSTAPTVSDDKTNTWTALTSVNNTNGQYIYRFYASNGTGGSGHTVTVTFGTSSQTYVWFLEMTGCTGTFGTQTTTGTQGAHTDPVSSGSITASPPATGEVLVATALVDDSGANLTFTEANGFTIQGQYANITASPMQGVLATKIVTSSGSYNASFSSGGGNLFWASVIDGFYGGASSPTFTNACWTSAGAIVVPTLSTSCWLQGGAFGNPDGSTVRYWQPTMGNFGVN